MKPAGETREDRIRECAYYLWEANGQPAGRDHEFWLRACEMVASNEEAPPAKRVRRQPKPSQAAEPARKRSRKSSSASIEQTAPAG